MHDANSHPKIPTPKGEHNSLSRAACSNLPLSQSRFLYPHLRLLAAVDCDVQAVERTLVDSAAAGDSLLADSTQEAAGPEPEGPRDQSQ